MIGLLNDKLTFFCLRSLGFLGNACSTQYKDFEHMIDL
jgi:hypothetical protein